MTILNNPKQAPHRVAVIIGRWQIFHKGHETLLKTALASAEQVVVVIGSAFRSRNPSNPFTWEERQAMIKATLTESERARIVYLPVRDYYDDDKWNSAVRTGVKHVTQGRGVVSLVSFKKDHTGYYQDNFSQWTRIEVQQEHAIDATTLRDVFFEGTDPDARLAVLAPFLNQSVLNYLQSWARLSTYRERVAEHQAVKAYRAKWGMGPFLTSDAVVTVTVNDVRYVLLIQRAGEGLDTGRGLWAVPGGFLDPGERHYDAAVRELGEETLLKLLASTMRHVLKSTQLFDHPGRSARARLISQAFHFDLGRQASLPEVHKTKETQDVKWVADFDLPLYEAKMLDDHAAILDRFIGLFPSIEMERFLGIEGV
jgi:bifunctional NMN adenylyltransferase/nudix hydrolase